MSSINNESTRRTFLKTSAIAGAALAAPALVSRPAGAADDETIRLGLVGCGGRGTGAVFDAFRSSANVKIVAMADLVPERLNSSRQNIKKDWGEKGNYAVTDDNCFLGVDAYKQLCAHPDVDVVIHTTPPGLRHLTLREAVKNGKHSFVEKPACVDPFSYGHVIESGRQADEKGLAIVSGTQYRRENSYREAIKRLQDGVIGDIVGGFAYYCTGTLWLNGTETDWNKWGGFDGTEYQMRNWLYFSWLSGDHIAEQAVHNLDAINWGFGGPPASAYGSGGRLVRRGRKYGNIYDHFSIDYDYPSGARVSFKCRQVNGAEGRVENRFVGTKGTLDIVPQPGNSTAIIRDTKGKIMWAHDGRAGNNAPYVQEHTDLIASIRAGQPIQEIQEVADSSLTAVIGREAAYSGQEVAFDWAANKSQLKLSPDSITVASYPVREVPRPGTYKLV
ncbi:MAG TPA: Gfo/Idh/MocA family oxidoreductase [Pirellulales bacterium]|nr:Gfo/Idh/MocA family oxidoreductase [Pirellulales bacterium]